MKTISAKDIKKNSTKLNNMALETTEKVVLKSIDKAEELQEFTAKSIKKTLDFSEKQQDKLFNNLEKSKKMIWSKLNKGLDFFSKK
ncbi:hypothetical protein [Polaribacter sp. Hel_I_88]|uniref:hypothetical protein n=1 Tax=Polaribacter sp. Hel_I_88 TaxID=1250006 RepID=UPI00047A400A|nr:hypothetical protein [Polaribacter sp. Hel_I_88]